MLLLFIASSAFSARSYHIRRRRRWTRGGHRVPWRLRWKRRTTIRTCRTTRRTWVTRSVVIVVSRYSVLILDGVLQTGFGPDDVIRMLQLRWRHRRLYCVVMVTHVIVINDRYLPTGQRTAAAWTLRQRQTSNFWNFTSPHRSLHAQDHSWLGCVVVRASDLWLRGRQFDSRPFHWRVA